MLPSVLADEPAVLVVVVAAIGDDTVGAPPGSADAAAYWRHPVEQREQLGDVVAVAARERPGKRDAAAVYEEMLLAAPTAAVDRARTGSRAPFFACTWLESAIARDHSISPAACNSASATARVRPLASPRGPAARTHTAPGGPSAPGSQNGQPSSGHTSCVRLLARAHAPGHARQDSHCSSTMQISRTACSAERNRRASIRADPESGSVLPRARDRRHPGCRSRRVAGSSERTVAGQRGTPRRRCTMRKILIATDGSPEAREAVEYGLELAEEEHAVGDAAAGDSPDGLDPARPRRGHSPDPRGDRAAARHRARRGCSSRRGARRSR